ncbi:MAG: methyl-accepting chemotaxis protein [Bacillota bacterium]|nr:methyl-accepting chemotaxis protein [Bacillota bacterium]
MSIRMKLSLGVSVVAILALFGTVAFMSSRSLTIIQNSEMNELKLIEKVIAAKLTDQIDATRAITLSVAYNTEVQRLFAESNRQALAEQLLPGYEMVKDQYAQMQFHLPDSTSFLRLHQPERYGDSLRDFRHTVNVANQTRTITAGLEEGRGGYGLRVVVPVFYQGQHIGSVEYGGDFGLPFLITLQKELGGDYFIYQLGASTVAWEEYSADTSGLLAGTQEADLWPIGENHLLAVSQGISQYFISADNRSAIMLYPLRDFQGKVIGFLKVVRDRSEVLAAISSAQRSAYILAGVAALITASCLFGLLTILLRPLNTLVTEAAKLGDGDFTGDISYKNHDEIGQVFHALATVREKLRESIGRIVESAYLLAVASQETSAATEQTAASIEQVASSTNEFASSAESLNNSAQDIAAQAHDMGGKAQSGTSAIERAMQTSEGLGARIAELSQVVKELGERSQRISKIVDVITDITSQTELLALNAAIEAARAGEHGRGFAVVAEEVRALAEQSEMAAKEITTLVKDIQNVAVRTVHDMEEGVRDAQSGAGIIKESGRLVQEIIDQVSAIIEKVQGMAVDIEQLGSGSEEIAAITEEQSASVEQIATSSEKLRQMADELQRIVAWFRL